MKLKVYEIMTIITKQMAKDFHEAQRATVRRDRKGEGLVTLTFKDTVRGKDVETQKHYSFDVNLIDYSDNKEIPYCIASLMWLDNNNDPETTAFHFVKEGDDVLFRFLAANDNQVMKEAGLSLDMLKMHVKRGTDRVKRFAFLIDTSCTKSDSSARMCGTNREYSSDISELAIEIEKIEVEA